LNAHIKIDYSVTTDPWRVLRVPGTLHGETGYIALKIDNLGKFDAKMADPQK
jgi:DNA primase catalytic subunit